MTARSAMWPLWLALALGVFVYLHNLGSEHAATNPDEHLYWQITRMTAEGGEWLPLKNLNPPERNTKPPALFWQGMVATDWGRHWELWRVRLPVVLYTLATAALVALVARRLSGELRTGLLAALAFLAFFSTYRYGRIVFTSAPETFWFFLPFAILLLRGRGQGGLSWPLALAFGLMVGAGLFYKSFALVIPFAAGLAWWTLQERGYRIASWLRADAPKIALLALLAVGVFSLWFVLDPAPGNIWRDFVLKENVGKFDAKGGNYFVNLLAGSHSVWPILFGYFIHTGLLAPAFACLCWLAWRGRNNLTEPEKLLWIWVITQVVIFALPNHRYEHYLLPAMPALAVLLALRWTEIPRWAFVIPLAAVAAVSLVFLAVGIVVTHEVGEGPLYPWFAWVLLGAIAAFAAIGAARADWTRSFACPAILLLYLAYAVFLIPFDGPRGTFDRAAVDAVRGRTVILPTVYGAHDEVYRFMLPGADVQTVRVEPPASLDEMRREHSLFIIPVPARDHTTEQAIGVRILGTRLQLVDRFTGNESKDMLRGNITGQLFKKDLLIEVGPD
jgi:4-amino-4-deoxy-L-arabinose transferase-like glycosyltransferase